MSESNVPKSVPKTQPVQQLALLKKDTRILTQKGVFTVDQLYGTYFHVSNAAGRLCVATIDAVDVEEPVYCITTQQKRKYYCSANQKWMTFDLSEVAAIKEKETKQMATIEEITDAAEVKVDDKKESEEIKVVGVATRDIVENTKILTKLTGVIGTSSKGSYTDGFVMGSFMGIKNGMLIWNVGADNLTAINVITRWIIEQDMTVVSKNEEKDTSVSIFATSEKLRKAVDEYGLVKEGLPTAVWTYSEEFRRGYIDSLISLHGSMYKVDEANQYFIELKSNSPIMRNDISDLFNMYGVINTTNGEHVRIDTNTFSKLFQLSNVEMQNVLNQTTSSAISELSATTVVSVEKTENVEKMFKINVNDQLNSFKTSLGYTC